MPQEKSEKLQPATCPMCEYDLTGLSAGRACPECGFPLGECAFVLPGWTKLHHAVSNKEDILRLCVSILCFAFPLIFVDLSTQSFVGMLLLLLILVTFSLTIVFFVLPYLVKFKPARHTFVALFSDSELTLQRRTNPAYGSYSWNTFKSFKLKRKRRKFHLLKFYRTSRLSRIFPLEFIFEAEKDEAEAVRRFVESRIRSC